MKKFAKLLSMVLAVAMVLTMFVGAFEYKDDAAIDEDKADAVYAVYDWAVMQGNDKGEFNPKGLLTRDEMSKIMYALKEVGLDAESYYGGFLSVFTDAANVPNWSKNYMGYAYIQNIFVGNDQKQINALGNLSYVQAAIVLLRSMGMENANNTYEVGDVNYNRYEGPKWFNNAVADGISCGLFKGLDISDFKANITREDVAVMIYNAIEKMGEAFYKLAESTNDVVIGIETKDKVDYFKLADDTLYPIGDLKVADYMGKQVEFSMEDKEIVSAIKAVNNTVFDTTIAGVKYDLNENGDKATISIDGTKIFKDLKAEDAAEIPVYLFFNNTTECGVTGLDELYNALDYEMNYNFWQDVEIIVSKKGVSVFYNPIDFFFAEELTLVPEVKDKQYTGNYTISYDSEDYYAPALINDLADDTLIALYIDGNEIKIAGFPKKVELTKFTATANSAGEFSFTMGGETYVNIKKVPDGAIASAMVFGTDMYAYVFEGKIIWIDSEAGSVNSDYVYVRDFSFSVVEGKPVYTVDAILNGELKQITVKGIIDDPADVKGNVYELYTLTKADEGDSMFDGLKAGDQVLVPVSGGYDVCETAGANIDQFVTALGYITLDGYTEDISNAVLVGYDAKTDTIFDANKLAVIGDSVKLDGKNIVEDALTVITVEKDSSGDYDYETAYVLVIYNVG